MWLPPDWMIWTYAIIMGLMAGGSLLIIAIQQDASTFTETDAISLIATYAVIGMWLGGVPTLSPVTAALLIIIIVLANIESTIRHLKSETWDTEEEKETVTAFTYGTVIALMLPAIYLLIVMAAASN